MDPDPRPRPGDVEAVVRAAHFVDNALCALVWRFHCDAEYLGAIGANLNDLAAALDRAGALAAACRDDIASGNVWPADDDSPDPAACGSLR